MERLLQELVVGWEGLEAYFAFDTTLLGEPGMIVRLALQVVLLFCFGLFLRLGNRAILTLPAGPAKATARA